ncbi:MAG: histidine kinase dimerization/phospho-acceptor domain-containing protein [Bacteroidales bacterium]
MKYLLKIVLLLFPSFLMAQNAIFDEPTKKQADSLLVVFHATQNDTIRMEICKQLGMYYDEANQDSAIFFRQHELKIARQLNQKLWEAHASMELGYSMWNTGNYAQSLHYYLQTVNLAQDKESEKNIWNITAFSKSKNPRLARQYMLSSIYDLLGLLYHSTGNDEKARSFYFKSLKIAEEVNDPHMLFLVNMDLGDLYSSLDRLDSALIFEQHALTFANSLGYSKYNGIIYISIAETYVKKGNPDSAQVYFNHAIREGKRNENNLMALANVYSSMAQTYNRWKMPDSVLAYAEMALKTVNRMHSIRILPWIYSSFSSAYKMKGKTDSAFIYLELSVNAKDSLANADKIKQFQNIEFDQEFHQQELEKEKILYQSKIRTNALMGGLFTLLVIAFLLYRNSKQKQKAKRKIELAYDQLKATQAQLIHSEKMASLGELTAGIAHEIQNPLNFVNNFSEVNIELAGDLLEEIKNGNLKEADDLVKDIIHNEEKINQHGRRADAIVKSMLQHSRSSTGTKEPTDLNALADEYLRLAYHGLRAKDKSFNADFKLEVDESLPKVNGGRSGHRQGTC